MASSEIAIPRCAYCSEFVADKLKVEPTKNDLVVCKRCGCVSKVVSSTQTTVLLFDDWLVLTTKNISMLREIEKVQKQIYLKNAQTPVSSKNNITLAVQTL